MAADDELTKNKTSLAASTKNNDDCDGNPGALTPLSPSLMNSTAVVGINSENYVDGGGGTTTLRHKLGRTLAAISDVVNENLIVVRYATFSTVLLLGAYGVANTPLFYQYKHVMEIPQKMFVKRKWIHGRIVGIAGNNSLGLRTREQSTTREPPNGIAPLLSSSSILRAARTEESGWSDSSDEYGNSTTNSQIQDTQTPIVVLFRHSSPFDRLLTQYAGRSPSRLLFSSANTHRHLLRIELAGVATPPSHSSSILSTSLADTHASPFPLLDQLIQKKANVSLQLIAQRVTSKNLKFTHKASANADNKYGPVSDDVKSTAICHLQYQQPKQWFTSKSASLEMVRLGQAWINYSGMVVPVSSDGGGSIIVNFNPTVNQLHNDAKFISELEKAEYSSWKSKVGIWSSDHIWRLRKEYLEEEESSKNKWQVWNLLKRGWAWMRK